MSPKLTKLTVEKSRTIESGKEWRKTIYVLEADVGDVENETKLDKYRKDFAEKLNDWLAEETPAYDRSLGSEGTAPEPPIKAEDIPDLDIGEINDCVWTRYGKNKGPAKSGHTGWIKNPIQFTSETFPKALSQLVKLIKKSPDGELVIGDMKYSLSGGDSREHFISRKPCAVEKATSKPSKAPKKAKPGETSPVHTVRQLFTRDLEQLLNFAVEGAFVVIKPRHYLSSNDFAKIAVIIRENGGEYISDGKNSHFRLPVK